MKEKTKMNKKRIIGIATIVAILLGVAAFAAVQISDVAKSVISASDLGIKVVMLENKDGSEAAVDGATEVKPGAMISRIAKVKNTGSEDSWVRVKVVLEVNGDTVPVTNVATDNKYVELQGLNADWEWKDGYWYYTKPLASGEMSKELFTGVKIIADSLDKSFDGSNLKVDAEGTQYKNNGSTVFEAQGWPNN